MSKKYGPVKKKVKAATIGAFIAGIIAHQLQSWGVALDFEVLGVFSLNEVVVGAGAFIAGWLKKEYPQIWLQADGALTDDPRA